MKVPSRRRLSISGVLLLVIGPAYAADKPLVGLKTHGELMFDTSGRYSLQLCSSGRAKFASNNRAKGTPEENEAAVRGCNPHWGRYSVKLTTRCSRTGRGPSRSVPSSSRRMS